MASEEHTHPVVQLQEFDTPQPALLLQTLYRYRVRGPAKICRHCGIAFRAKGTKRQYCSLDCWYASVRESAEADFWAKVDKGPYPKGCWLWTGYIRKTKMNYGKHRGQLVHRYAYQLYHPDEILTEDDLICHTCDVCPCVRDEHLFKGTYLDNNRDAVQKGRNEHGTRHHSAKLTDEIVRAILRAWSKGNVNQRALCRQYNISPPVMNTIVHRKAWTHVSIDLDESLPG